MEKVLHVNSMHLSFLRPLLKWRIMDLQSLWQECEFKMGYDNFYRIMRNLERDHVLETHLDPFNKRKYFYLGKEGEKLLHHDHPTSVSKETLIHDLKVSEISRKFMELNLVDEILLEHQIVDKSNFKNKEKLIPDAVYLGQKNNQKYKMAFELELSKKSNSRLTEKARMYQESEVYDFVLYFFAQEKFIEKYTTLFEKELNLSIKNKFMFFCNEALTSKDFNLATTEGVFRNEKVNLLSLFTRNDHAKTSIK